MIGITKVADIHNLYEQNTSKHPQKVPSFVLVNVSSYTLFNYAIITTHKVFHGESATSFENILLKKNEELKLLCKEMENYKSSPSFKCTFSFDSTWCYNSTKESRNVNEMKLLVLVLSLLLEEENHWNKTFFLQSRIKWTSQCKYSYIELISWFPKLSGHKYLDYLFQMHITGPHKIDADSDSSIKNSSGVYTFLKYCFAIAHLWIEPRLETIARVSYTVFVLKSWVNVHIFIW